jgi:prepilin-type N-terminal cleavage/methylation domain-containing protein
MLSDSGCKGLTLVELLVAMVVTSIILSAVATLAYAMSAANGVAADSAEKQAQLRCARLRISELIRHCKLVHATNDGGFAVWQADSNGDRRINMNELVLVERGSTQSYLRLCEFPQSQTATVTLGDIETLAPADYDVTYAQLIPQCSNVQFMFDVACPNTRFVVILFDLEENSIMRRYQIAARLRAWAGHLLDDSGQMVGSDDD